jgi:succinyl-CoA synthetase beta subunit
VSNHSPRMIKDSGMKIVAFDELDDAAQKAVELATA